jgi:PilZ domain
VKDFHDLPKCHTWTNRAWRPISTDEETVAHSERKAVEDEPGSENRRYPRLSCGGIADLRVIPNGGKETGFLVNLSKRGCCFLADVPLRGHAGSNIEVHLKVKGVDLRVSGIIRHVHKGIRAGIEFVALSDRKCNQVDELVAELSEMNRQSARLREQAAKARRRELASLGESVQKEQTIESPVYRNLLRFYRD